MRGKTFQLGKGNNGNGREAWDEEKQGKGG